MTKRSFRATKTKQPSYPRLVDLEAGALRRWGLAAVGGLLIGNAACTRTTGAPTAKPAENKAEKASESTASEPPHGGIVPVQRIASVDAGAPDTRPIEATKAEPREPAVKAPVDRPRDRVPVAGKIRPQRLRKNPFE
jgi:hypothetical protein